MALESPILLKNIPTPPWGEFADRKTISYDDYVKAGGYTSLEKAIGMEPKDIIDVVKDAELRGRGGAGFPAGMKWSFLPPQDGGQRFLAINCDESEPATFKDQVLTEFDPHIVIEGIAICKFVWDIRTFGYWDRI